MDEQSHTANKKRMNRLSKIQGVGVAGRIPASAKPIHPGVIVARQAARNSADRLALGLCFHAARGNLRDSDCEERHLAADERG
jgi:hypothetical protein